MKLYEGMLENELIELVRNYLDGLDFDCSAVIKSRAQKIIEEVYKILCDDSLTDFMKIDNIVEVFNKNGVSCGSCHDF